MREHLTEEDMRKIFTDPNSLRKALVLWKTAEKRGCKLVRRMINERKERLRGVRNMVQKEKEGKKKIFEWCPSCSRYTYHIKVTDNIIKCEECGHEQWY